MSGKVSIIIVTWNSAKDIGECLNSVYKLVYKNFNVVVVDNNSKDDTADIVSKEFPQCELVKLEKNLYYTGGNNYGFNYAIEKYNPEYLLVLNPDTLVEENLLNVLLGEIEKDEKICAVGPKIKFKGGKRDGLINSASLFYDNFHSAYDLGFEQKDNGQFDNTMEVFGVTGTCILFRSDFIKRTGGFWSILKMYVDEVELFIRANKLGWKVIYTGKTTVWHKYMQSTSQKKHFNHEKLKMRNWLLIALRHYTLRDKLKMIRDYIKFIF